MAATRESSRREDTPVYRWPEGSEGTILHAFASNPTLGWTAQNLAGWYGMRVDRVRAILRDLVARGLVGRTDAAYEEFRLSEILTADLGSEETAFIELPDATPAHPEMKGEGKWRPSRRN